MDDPATLSSLGKGPATLSSLGQGPAFDFNDENQGLALDFTKQSMGRVTMNGSSSGRDVCLDSGFTDSVGPSSRRGSSRRYKVSGVGS